MKQRHLSIDVVRGFDMFWIIGATWVVRALEKSTDWKPVHVLAAQLSHSEWEGLTAYDVVFPLFIVLVGASLVFSLSKIEASADRAAARRRLIKRTLLLFALGVFYNGGLSEPWPQIRLMGVLQRIALCYFITGLLFLHVKRRGLVMVFFALLAGYWAALRFVPVPGIGAGSFEEGRNLASWVDARLLPGLKHRGRTWDPEGLLSTLPAVATCLMGVLAGVLHQAPSLGRGRRFSVLLAVGIAAGAAGWLWGMETPVIKKLWTSSYVLLTGGLSFVLLAFAYLVVDVLGRRRWAAPLLWIGANPLALYLSFKVIDYAGIAQRLAGGGVARALGRWGDVVLALIPLVLVLWLARWLSKHRLFIRV